MISIIIPVYNAEKYIEKCVDSLVNQTYKNLEIILVNDGSTDNSGSLCDSFAAKDDRIKVIHKQNGGVSSARNAGLDAATGEYITFADSDDWLDTSAFDICAAEMKKNNLDLLVCGYNTVFPNRITTTYMDCNMFTRYEYQENISKYITTSVGFNSVWNKIYSAHIINSHHIRFDETMQINEDGVFNCRYFVAAHYIKCIPNAFYYYNMTESNSTAKGRIDYLPQGKKFSQAMIDATQSKGLYNCAAEAINDFYRHMLHIHLMFLLLPNEKISTQQRIQAINQLYNTTDGTVLELYLSSLSGIKNKLFYLLYKARCSKLLILCVQLVSGGK
ncbi:MAG: glycosyltransferase family 2 protein [Oscillospiraceae bacterium]|nr:glycosyltransferase family 2 protein [Oscillospiraceae bacterium]